MNVEYVINRLESMGIHRKLVVTEMFSMQTLKLASFFQASVQKMLFCIKKLNYHLINTVSTGTD
jgi:hypothetical protein